MREGSKGFLNHVHGTVRLKAVRKATNSALKLGHWQIQLRTLREIRLVKEHIANLEQIGYNVSIGS